jgi:hypothetical protein
MRGAPSRSHVYQLYLLKACNTRRLVDVVARTNRLQPTKDLANRMQWQCGSIMQAMHGGHCTLEILGCVHRLGGNDRSSFGILHTSFMLSDMIASRSQMKSQRPATYVIGLYGNPSEGLAVVCDNSAARWLISYTKPPNWARSVCY